MIPPTFSIITAVRNGLPDLQRTGASLGAQTLQDLEWIVIDAASDDGTKEWLSSHASFGDRLQWVSEPDNGIAEAWNKGIEKARGQQVLFLNAGDIYDPELIKRFKSEINHDRITCCHARLQSEEGQTFGLFLARPALLWRGMHLPHNWASVPRNFYAQYGGYKLMPHSMDFEWFYRYYKAKGKQGFNVINETLGSYRMGGYSDHKFKEGFAANAEILVANGMPKIFAMMVRIGYTLKHKLRHR